MISLALNLNAGYALTVPKLRPDSAITERDGVQAVGRIVTRDLKWIFREQTVEDFGIDAHIEVVDGKTVTGKLIAAQIKSGTSYFHATAGGWLFNLKADDLEYWQLHSLPVIVVMWDPIDEVAYWQVVRDEHITVTDRGAKKLFIPNSQTLGASSMPALSVIADGNPYEARVRQLQLLLPWMKLLQSGRRILVDAEEWINKSSGRGEITLTSVDEDGEYPVELATWTIFVGLRPYSEVLPTLVPWADVVLHDETYEEADEDAWESESVFVDSEGDSFERESFQEWRERQNSNGLRPYKNGAGEVDFWRLELKLNELGRGFVIVDEFAGRAGRFLAASTRS